MLSRRALVAAAGTFAPRVGAADVPPAARPISRLDQRWWRERHAAKLIERAARPVDLVLLGDSITQQLEGPDYRAVRERYLGYRRVLNLGFNGDSTCHLLWRIEHGEVDAIKPRAAVLLIGANNFGRAHWAAADTLTGIQAVLAATRVRLPYTPVLLMSVLPSDRGAWVTEQTARVNAALAASHRAGGAAVEWFDVTALFTRDGRVDPAKFRDPGTVPPSPALHPTPEAQAAMFAAIEPRLSALLGDRDHR